MQSTMTFRRYMVLVAVMVSASFGDTFLSLGMKQVGPVSLDHLSTLLAALRVPWVLAGIVLLTAFFASYLTALSWADLTFVLPATSFGYVIIALLSRFWLHEIITPARWAGILLITLGVGFVTRGPSYTSHASELPPPDLILNAVPVHGAAEHARERSA
jgi:drug/metabolite transporter (DMT)-like permease